jgi:hypothetical protein
MTGYGEFGWMGGFGWLVMLLVWAMVITWWSGARVPSTVRATAPLNRRYA